ncbi:helix-turn-helix transcriptional regulator [Kaistia dalseonensis]|uniref:Ribosome-binding protein aMBF1 (Putative translation factor) n=1 Tax=Kaistia dalseonensis TaxID=410840 RepID=A0ABU0H9X0_9HYPH|nr:helix-turn-helix transcriptional regulator [Kaistia dalseonensis]MCX5496493.1 helix-turn-helix transcriptional regulator [Kaistia dalseonensis]MDQ0439115.1 ribosome-binding protein aMBF1 (putative translation factor) [Kaistia dalseonensis]
MNSMSVQQYRQLPDIGPRDIGALPAHVADKISAGETAVKAVREWRGLSQIDLADRSGVAITQIQRAEIGHDASIAMLRCLARALRVRDDILIR